jgi:hypothetical protein
LAELPDPAMADGLHSYSHGRQGGSRCGDTPYARGEVYYESKSGTWDMNTYSFGAAFPIWKRFEFEGYYEHEITTGGSPPHVTASGQLFPCIFAGILPDGRRWGLGPVGPSLVPIVITDS